MKLIAIIMMALIGAVYSAPPPDRGNAKCPNTITLTFSGVTFFDPLYPGYTGNVSFQIGLTSRPSTKACIYDLPVQPWDANDCRYEARTQIGGDNPATYLSVSKAYRNGNGDVIEVHNRAIFVGYGPSPVANTLEFGGTATITPN